MKKKAIFLMLTLIMMSVASVNAQVRIGSLEDPHEGALLDLSQSGGRGLLFPSVFLFNPNDFQLDGDKTTAGGMVVYNTNSELDAGEGLYIWNGDAWQGLANNAQMPTCVPVTATTSSLKAGTNARITVTVTSGSPAFSYVWKKDGSTVQTKNNVAATSDFYITAGAGIYTCTVTNPCTATPLNFTFEVNAGGEALKDNGNGTYTDSNGNMVYEGETYIPVDAPVPGFYKNEADKIVYTGADGIPGNEDDNTYAWNPDAPVINAHNASEVIVLEPYIGTLNSNTGYQISLDYAKPEDATARSVVQYLSSAPDVISVDQNGYMTTCTTSADWLPATILILLDDGTIITKDCSVLTTSSYNVVNRLVTGILASSHEIYADSIKHLDFRAISDQSTSDILTASYTMITPGTTSSVTQSGWFIAGSTPETVQVKVKVTSSRTSNIFEATMDVIVKALPTAEALPYETGFSGNWLELIPALNYAGGTGTEQDPWRISSVRQLKKLSDDIKELGSAAASYQKYFKLTADLDFSGATIQDYLINGFWGNFDGNGHLIKNLSFNSNEVLGGSIFGSISYATLKNLGRIGGSVSAFEAGGLALSATSSTISNCFNTTPLTGSAVGGIVRGIARSSIIENCYNTAPLTSSRYNGGIIGYVNGNVKSSTLKNSYNAGNLISTEGTSGGLVGQYNSFRNLFLENVFNLATVTNTSNQVGAIMGSVNNADINNAVVSNVRTAPAVTYSNGALLMPDRLVGYGNKAVIEQFVSDNAAQMSAEEKYGDESYVQSAAFAAELGSAFKHAPGRTPKLAWEK
jgi:hypothetical protein